ncbi:MAG: SRPBCC family protein [Acidobacteriaceae bacterium]
MRHTFQAEQWLPYPPELVFAFFANPENLPRLMPPWQKARIEEASFAPPPPRPPSSIPQRGIAAGAGTRLTLSFRAFPLSPIRIPWEAEISEFAWNDHFCDTQLRGPFKYWKHCHHIRAESRPSASPSLPTPGSLLLDHVYYELPLGPLGDLGNLLLIRRQLQGTFRFRHRRTSDLLALAAAQK